MSVEKPSFIENFKNWPDHKRGIAFMIFGSSAFACAHVFFKLAGENLHAFSVGFWNDIFALMTVLVLGMKLGGFKKTFQSQYKTPHILRSVLLSIGFVFLIQAFKHMPLANVLSISFSAPIIGTILSLIILKEYPKLLHWVSISLGFCGIIIILNPAAMGFNTDLLYPLAAAFMFGGAMVASRIIPKDEPVISFGVYPIVSTLIITGAYMIYDFEVPTITEFFWLFWAGILGGFGVVSVGIAFTLGKTAAIAPLEYIQMIWAVLFGLFIFGDVLDLRTAMGAAMIISSGFILVRYAEVRKRKTS